MDAYVSETNRIRSEKRAKKDPLGEWLRYFEENFWIENKANELQLMKPLREAQRRFYSLVWHCLYKWKILCRILVLKDRQQGITTASLALCYRMLREKGLRTAFIGQDLDATQKNLERVRLFHENWNGGGGELVGSKASIIKIEGMQGEIDTYTANRMAGTRGGTRQISHGMETAWWEKAGAAMALLNSVADLLGSIGIEETTANMEDPNFHPKWVAAEEQCSVSWSEDSFGNPVPELNIVDRVLWNGWIPFFISCLLDHDARKEFHSEEDRARFIETMDNEERSILSEFPDATMEFLYWRRHTIHNKHMGIVEDFNQEHPLTAAHAFIASGSPRFNQKALRSMPILDPEVGSLVYRSDWERDVKFRPDVGGLLRIYKRPEKGRRYVLGVDTAEGIVEELSRRADDSVAMVLDADSGEQCAVIYGRISPEHLIVPVYMLGLYYHTAFLIIELNASGRTLVVGVAEKGYPPHMIYHDEDEVKVRGRRSREMGFRTTIKSRPPLIDYHAFAIEDGSVVFHDKKTVREHLHFQQGKGSGEAAPGYHDDHVLAAALCTRGIRKYPFDLRRRQEKEWFPNSPFGRSVGRDSPEQLDEVTGLY